ncbi:alpha/beta hydrolase [Paenibacillus sediminis]|uniref:Proline iminopeptidase n=1 Tax=Paenibacillus sediminis TaxID=664909 RepID=A0ABS4H260_9BACL|nr:alpha/beta hydrolase [Paenibacillus sediminis]MBP1936546.1 proline iminopeptidase [Paenibacillus sediminis]
MSGFISIQDHKIYYEIVGEENLPVYLYLHGGPGTGSYDFMLLQAKRLSPFMRIIAIDQSGVLRSDIINDEDHFTFQQLIDDCEFIREYFELKEWGLIAHSFGGYLAAHYQLQHPDKITQIIFECPTFDLGSSSRSLLLGAANEYKRLGKYRDADECLRAAEIKDSAALWSVFTDLTNNLGEHRDNLYVHGENKQFFNEIVRNSGIPNEQWGRSGTHQRKLFQEGKVFESVLERLESIQCPMFLIKGKYDWVASEDQISVFSNGQMNRKVSILNHSGHFPRFEEPDLYADVIREFVCPAEQN